MNRKVRLVSMGMALALMLALAAAWAVSAAGEWPPVKVDLNIQQDGNIFTATIWVSNEGDFNTDTLNVRGQVPKGAVYVDSWAGSGRGFNKGVFDGSDVGWVNPAGVKAGGKQGPFVYIFDTSALAANSRPYVSAWVSWAAKTPGTAVSKALSLGSAPTAAAADMAKGGRLYDKWWQEAGTTAPQGDQPSWAAQTTNTRKGTDTWRCKECHGWDYAGKDGAYGSGSHKTGFVGVAEAGSKKSQAELVSILQGSTNPQHNFSQVLDSTSINDLASFLRAGLVDVSKYVDYAAKKPKISNTAHGKALYEGACAACHGADGRQLNFGSQSEPEYVGTLAKDNPQEFQHKVRNGQPGTSMPAAIVSGWSMEDVMDVLAYAQTLPTE